MRMSLLDMVQNILSAMDDDEVNSITDSVSSMQVAEELRTTYYEILDGVSNPYEEGVVQLTASGNSALPTVMYVPTNCKSVKWIKYDRDGTGNYGEVTYLTPEDFVRTVTLVSLDVNHVSMTVPGANLILRIQNDKNPTYYTSFDNNTIVFDSFDSGLDSTLQNVKTLCWGETIPVFTMADSFIPQLDPQDFSLLLSEAKAACFVNHKQVSNSKEETRARRQRVRSQNNRYRINQKRDTVDYSRRTI